MTGPLLPFLPTALPASPARASALAAACAGAWLLSGCSASDSAPAAAPVALTVRSAAAVDIRSVEVVSAKGAILASGPVQCTDATTCVSAVSVDATAARGETLDYRFLDASGALVAAHVERRRAPDGAIALDDRMLGVYAFGRLKAAGDWRARELRVRLNHLLLEQMRLDGSADPFETLGRLLAAQLRAHAATEQEYLADLQARLARWESLPATARTVPVFGSRSLAGPTARSTTTKAAMAPKASAACIALGSVTDVGKEVSSLFEAAGFEALFGIMHAVGEGACKFSETDIAEQLADVQDTLRDMSAQLNDLSVQVSALDYRFDDIARDIATLSGNDSLARIATHAAALDLQLANYASLLQPPVAGLPGYASLQQLVAAQGGLTPARLQDPNNAAVALIKASGAILAELQGMAGAADLRTLRQGLDTMCADASSIAGDVLQQREKCNVTIAHVRAQLYYYQATVGTMLADIAQTVAAAYRAALAAGDPGTLALLQADLPGPVSLRTVGASAALGYAWDAVPAQLQRAIVPAQWATLGASLGDLYEVSPELPQALKDGMVAAGCSTEPDAETVSPAILEWHTQPQAGLTRPYVVTLCPSGDSTVTARYAYQDDGSAVVNVLGVLVGASRWPLTPPGAISAQNDNSWLCTDYTWNCNAYHRRFQIVAPATGWTVYNGARAASAPTKVEALDSAAAPDGKVVMRRVTPAQGGADRWSMYEAINWDQGVGPAAFVAFDNPADKMRYVWQVYAFLDRPEGFLGMGSTYNEAIVAACVTADCQAADLHLADTPASTYRGLSFAGGAFTVGFRTVGGSSASYGQPSLYLMTVINGRNVDAASELGTPN